METVVPREIANPLVSIPTSYRGITYRSRTEARWAIFFDRAGVRFCYEPDGFDLGGIRYLPDFWLPDLRIFVEVKPYEPRSIEEQKCRRLALAARCDVLLVMGDPGQMDALLFSPRDYEPGSTEHDLGPARAFFGKCHGCDLLILSLEWNDGQAWGDRRLAGARCPHEVAGRNCTDHFTPFGRGLEEAVNAACDFRWRSQP
jgi:hypothetical protein